MAELVTQLAQLINPEVMADMISAKIPKKIVVAPFAKVDTTLAGRPGNTVTVPQYKYIGDAEDVAEGVACGTVKLETETTEFSIKKAMKAVSITDEAVLSGYGNPVGEANNQLAKSVASKIDNDAMEALLNEGIQLKYDGSKTVLSYEALVNAIDLFDEEVNTEKVLFVNPKQVTQLRKDANFLSVDKYPGYTIVSGEVGKIANTRIVTTKKVTLDSETSSYYTCPLIKLNNDAETEDDAAALTIFMKKGLGLETERISKARKTEISVDEHYGVAVTNMAKVVQCKFKK